MRIRNRLTGKTTQRAVTLVVVVSLLASTAFLTSAAGATQLTATADSDTLGVGETTTVQFAVENADHGVGAGEFAVSVDGGATITDVTVAGAPGTVVATPNEDNTSVSVAYFTADTADTGTVTFLTITVEGTSAGTADVTLGPTESNPDIVLSDERGNSYDVSSVLTTLTVTTDDGQPTTEEPTTEEPTTEEPTTEEPTTEEPSDSDDSDNSDNSDNSDSDDSDDSDNSDSDDSDNSDDSNDSNDSNDSTDSDNSDSDDATDSDGDGLTDEEEAELGTDPTNTDSDDDCWSDNSEINRGTDPLDAESLP